MIPGTLTQMGMWVINPRIANICPLLSRSCCAWSVYETAHVPPQVVVVALGWS
jgi:hypothetical protein